MAKLGFGILGAGRIGRHHARNLTGAIDRARVVGVMDAIPEAAEEVAAASAGAYATQDAEALISDKTVDCVLIASPTTLHAEQIVRAARAGKAIFCEKPVAFTLPETIRAMEVVEETGVPFQIGFNRRFDPGIAAVAKAIHTGGLGEVEMFRSQSGDPSPPPLDYVATSGGIYLDSAIHDIDVARFIVGEVERVTALGRILVEPGMEEHGDVDTSVLTLEFASGALGIIQNSRRTVYGHDVRVEVHAAAGKVVSEEERDTQVWTYTSEGIQGDYTSVFLERFRQAYIRELQSFVDAVLEERKPSPGPSDAIESLRVAIAATRSLHEERPVRLAEVA
jgi:myo-inositol 2-dehydrogenase/D-chiro-inositol 1-dehydrogenase